MGELRSVDLVDPKKAKEVCHGQYPSIGTCIGSYVNHPKFRAKGLEALLSLCNPDPNAPRPELPGSSDDEEGDAEATS